MRRFTLGVAIVAVMALCLGVSSDAMADAIRFELVSTTGGDAGGNAVVVPTQNGAQVIVVGHGLEPSREYRVIIVPCTIDDGCFSTTIWTNGAGVLTLHDSSTSSLKQTIGVSVSPVENPGEGLISPMFP